MSCMEEVINILRKLLSDLNYDNDDQIEYIKEKGYCAGCYFHLEECMCSDDDRKSSYISKTNLYILTRAGCDTIVMDEERLVSYKYESNYDNEYKKIIANIYH